MKNEVAAQLSNMTAANGYAIAPADVHVVDSLDGAVGRNLALFVSSDPLAVTVNAPEGVSAESLLQSAAELLQTKYSVERVGLTLNLTPHEGDDDDATA